MHLILIAEDLGVNLGNLRLKQRNLSVESLSARGEDFPFIGENIFTVGARGERDQLLRPRKIGFELLFRSGTGLGGQQGDKLLLQHVLGGVHLYALQHNERLSFLHLIAFTDEDGVDDTAFKVLDGLAFRFDFDLSGSDDGAADFSEHGPCTEYTEEQKHHKEPLPDDLTGILNAFALWVLMMRRTF